ncbi:MAG: 1-phosphofructokinase family hexose kinase [Treponema sp.]|jgi:1-phosphofructokinase|nr:1-phosphofructokinase family hexose kinase [Treponema sp.]
MNSNSSIRVLTLTPNPAIDETIQVERLVPGEVHRASSVRRSAGGKGINVSSCLAGWGIKTRASGFLGRNNAEIFEDHFRLRGIEDAFIRLEGDTRTNIKITGGGNTTDINLPGASLGPEDPRRLLETAAGLAGGVEIAILAGSLPPLCPPALYKDLTGRLRAEDPGSGGRGAGTGRPGCFVILDTDGEALREALAAGTLPSCIKPNERELSQWAGREFKDLPDMLRTVVQLRGRGIALIVVSMGRKGAVFAGKDRILRAWAETGPIFSTVGAGDAMVAGVAAALLEGALPRGQSLERIARLGAAFAAAKLGSNGPDLPEKAFIEETARNVEIDGLDSC